MKLIIAGSRDCTDINIIRKVMNEVGLKPSVIISGCARGADRLGEIWANENGVPVQKFPANWNKHGKSAGYIRNVEMAKHADTLLALWDGKSRGTKHMIDHAKSKGLDVHIYYC